MKKSKRSKEFMQQAVDHYFTNGMNALATGRLFGVSNCSVTRWIKDADILGLTVPNTLPDKKAKHTYYTREFMQEVLDYSHISYLTKSTITAMSLSL